MEGLLPDTLGARLRRLRIASRLSCRELARWLGRPHTVVSRWELDTLEPTPTDLVTLARALRVPIDQLLQDAALSVGRRWSSRSHPASRRVALGAALSAARQRSDVDLRTAVARTGISGRRILRIEGGVDPSLAELRLLAALVQRTQGDLIRSALAPPRSGVDKSEAPHVIARNRHHDGRLVYSVRRTRPLVRPTVEPAVTKGTRLVLNKCMFIPIVLGPLAA